MRSKIILDLCGGTGAWSKPYKDNGYDVLLITSPCHDVKLWSKRSVPKNIYGILAAPPCTHLAGSGARWWKAKGKKALKEGLATVDACLRIIKWSKPMFWALENPVGRLVHHLGKPKMYFQPWEYGDPYTKKTCLWGEFNIPDKSPVNPTEGGKMWRLSPSPDRASLRSITPSGFAKAFFKANQ